MKIVLKNVESILGVITMGKGTQIKTASYFKFIDNLGPQVKFTFEWQLFLLRGEINRRVHTPKMFTDQDCLRANEFVLLHEYNFQNAKPFSASNPFYGTHHNKFRELYFIQIHTSSKYLRRQTLLKWASLKFNYW